jgi:hypothetical protein
MLPRMSDEHDEGDAHSPSPSYATSMELIVVSMIGFLLPVTILLLFVKHHAAVALVISIPLLILGLGAQVRTVMNLTMRDD